MNTADGLIKPGKIDIKLQNSRRQLNSFKDNSKSSKIITLLYFKIFMPKLF